MIDRIDELELADLRSGRDQYSNLNLPALTQLKPLEAAQIAEALPLEVEQAAALRWLLRGLNVERAVAKVVLNRKAVEAIRDKQRVTKDLRESVGITDEELKRWMDTTRRREL